MNIKQAQELLAKLGGSSRKVAATLKAQGITGHPKRAMSCPISQYFKLHGAVKVGTSSGFLSLYTKMGWVAIVLPPAVKKFVVSFDQGRYQALIEKSK